MLTREELYLLRTYLCLKMEDIAFLMSCTKQTISNLENGKSTQPSSLLFYEKVLLEQLANSRTEVTTYEQYLEKQIARYMGFLINSSIMESEGFKQYIDNDICTTFDLFKRQEMEKLKDPNYKEFRRKQIDKLKGVKP